MRDNIQIPELLFAFDSFILDCEARSLRPSTIRAYRENVLWFFDFVTEQGVFRVKDVTAHHIRAYLVSLQKRKWAQATIASAYRMVRVFFNYLVRDELLDHSPMAKVAIPTARGKSTVESC